MRYDTDTIRAVVQSAAARRALGYISPIYGEAENFLHILNASGLEMDEVNAWVEEIVATAMPQTVTKSGLRLWEIELGITPGAVQTIEQRRQTVISKIRSAGSSNPWRISQTAGAAAGYNARTVENTGINKFTVWIQHYRTDEGIIRKALDAIKPAHLIYEIKNEEIVRVSQMVRTGAHYSRTITMTQVKRSAPTAVYAACGEVRAGEEMI